MADVIQELRHALRMHARHPGFSLIAVAMLALGIAANTAIFSVVNAVLLSPLPFPAQDRLVLAWTRLAGTPRWTVSPANFLDWRRQNDVFESMAAFSQLSVSLTGDGTPERLRAASVSSNFFQVLGVAPALGTTFQATGEDTGPRQVAVLGHALWKNRFAADAHIVGRQVRLDGRSYEVLGVMPEHFQLPAVGPTRTTPTEAPQLWIPAPLHDIPQLGPDPMVDLSQSRDTSYLRVLGRLKPGVTLERASAAMGVVADGLSLLHPQTNTRSGIALVPLREQLLGDVQPVLWLLLGAVGLVLAIACANVANLFLVRASARRPEMAVRAALGAARWRLVRQLLTESVLLSLVAGALGLLLATWGMEGLLKLIPPELPRLEDVGVDGRVLAFTLCMSLGTGVLFGLLPALQASTPDLNGVLRQTGGGKLAGGYRSRNALVVGEVALAVVLLISAGLLVRSLWRLQAVEPGFQQEGVLTWSLSLPPERYPDEARQSAFFQQVVERVAQVPGVEGAGAISDLPLGGANIWLELEVEGRPVPRTERPSVGFQSITPGYLGALGIPLLRGRDVATTDTSKSEPVVLLNQAAARQHFPGQEAVGQRIRLGDETSPMLTVVGVVGDVKYDGPAKEARPEAYVAALQRTLFFSSFVVRTRGEPATLIPAVRAAVGELDKDLPLTDPRTMEQRVTEATARPRFMSVLVAMFACMSLLLAGVGLSGVMAYTVRQRTRELGIRMALGASPADVLRMVLGHGLRLALVGVAMGMVGAFAVTRVMSSQLYGVSTTDPLTFGTLAAVVMAVALVATWLPAYRATRVDPQVALRGE
ncbi:ABC transporter permease [Myxococcus sp. K15C18031901]|uniref:ABC transporter permease n=1 Tax=Myxococcus dinghuensis TaxID=2906761 RepID=UPI0020A7FA0F|nr:ABC transporter permease [Myxococcus dinghuensis]MCP3098036.1 ABC transporter permease [Myxococcus dinghuensis]